MSIFTDFQSKQRPADEELDWFKPEFSEWDFENDYVVLDRPKQFVSGEPITKTSVGYAYVVETEKGSFYTISHPYDMKWDLMHFDNSDKEQVVMRDVRPLASNCKGGLLIVLSIQSLAVYLIDTRGILYSLGEYYGKPDEYTMLSIQHSKKTGYYNVYRESEIVWSIRAISKREALMQYINADPVQEHPINSKYKSFFTKLTSKDFVFACSKGKKKKIFEALKNRGLPYEDAPNMFTDDPSHNIVIHLTPDALEMDEVRYLTAKYDRCYDIFEVPVQVYVRNLDMDYRDRDAGAATFEGGKADTKKVLGILDTLRAQTDSTKDVELYTQYFRKPHKAVGLGCEDAIRGNKFMKLVDGSYWKDREAINTYEEELLK